MWLTTLAALLGGVMFAFAGEKRRTKVDVSPYAYVHVHACARHARVLPTPNATGSCAGAENALAASHATKAAPMSIVASLRERLLALGTGGFAGIVVSYYASRDIWQHAHDHGVLIDSTIDELRDLQGYERPSPPQARAPLKSSGGVAPLVRAQLGPRWRPTVFVPGAQAAPLASPFEVQLRLDLATAWNTRVRGLYDFMRRWAC